jgi:hypothetical protein
VLQAIIDCLVKSYECHELDPVEWEEIRDACKDILTQNGLKEYQENFEEEEDLYMQWGAAVDHPPLGMNLLIGQLDDEDIRAMDDEENNYDTGSYDQMKKNFFKAYHMVKAHKQFLEENPKEVVHFRRFQLWYSQQVAGGHAPGRTPGDDELWVEEDM